MKKNRPKNDEKQDEGENKDKPNEEGVDAKDLGIDPNYDKTKLQKELEGVEKKGGRSKKVQKRKTDAKICGHEKRPPNWKRYDGYNHFPLVTKNSVRCKNERCGKTDIVFCKKCNVHLCLKKRRNCFTNFHLLHETNEQMSEVQKQTSIETKPKHSIRFDEHNHFPTITATPVRCKNCFKKTFICCQKCKVHLCLVSNRNCFTDFHVLSLDDIKIE